MVTVRPAREGDALAWRALWLEYLDFYGVTLDGAVTEATWARILTPGSGMGMLVAEDDGEIAGFATWVSHPSTWTPTPDLYLEDLFVAEDHRGTGAGRAMIDGLIALGRDRGWSRLYWMTDAANVRARALYDSYAPTDGHVRYRLRLT